MSFAACALAFSCACEREKKESAPPAAQQCATSPRVLSEIKLKGPWEEPGVQRQPGQEVPPAPLAASAELDRSPSARTVRLFIPLADDRFLDCLAHGSMELEVPACEPPLEFAIKKLLGGLASAPEHGLTDPMQRSTKGEGIPPLAGFYRGLEVNNEGIVLLHFSEPALAYLNQAACAADAVRSSLSRTAKQFEGISGVAFFIDGKLFDSWDG